MFYGHARFYLYVLTWLPFALCLVFYGLRSPWRQSRVGQGLFTLYGALTAVLTMAVVAQITAIPDVAIDVLRFLTLGGVLAAGWIQLANILRLQREARADPNPHRRKTDS